jgi:hypothetical protein
MIAQECAVYDYIYIYIYGDPDVDGRIILRWMFRKLEGVVGTGGSLLRIGTCEYGKEPSGSIKCGEFLG